ncbi:hypothetical protein BDD43_3304 [Mucilaginibacter gracilis]|uniref:Uncharacterized protein n=1 Tax=Mucilaginibacter gracilis TaxID=423350 RepID=A0A495J2P5_9SPHI|nr:hypothetical protein [Mucilaginibacter gracilis]RKR83103.1 hypothetical protein BDD43_3304 [Mucilaginibacter gracilis]
MTLTIKRKGLIGLACIILLFIITNPTIKDFKEHLGVSKYEGLYRNHNFFIFSIYGEYDTSEYWIAIAGNFFGVEENKSQANNESSINNEKEDIKIGNSGSGDDELITILHNAYLSGANKQELDTIIMYYRLKQKGN